MWDNIAMVLNKGMGSILMGRVMCLKQCGLMDK